VTVVEVGPGPGGLTRALLMHGAAKVIAVRDDPGRSLADQRAGVEFQRVGLHHLEAAGIMRGDLGERRPRTSPTTSARSSSPAG
jgi:16S rRNA A1518/A1519 N6-dimethyltransferase RsmA/KsgA/DIM1 with predicted DNA glycosylase/AP lyase activity